MIMNRQRIYAAGLAAVSLFATAAYNHVIAQQGPDPKSRNQLNDYLHGVARIEGAFQVENTVKTHELVQRYGAIENEVERAALVKELTDLSSEEFDQKQASRSKQLDEMEAQLKRLRAIHERRTKEKDEIVRDHVRHLLRGADGLGWGVDGDDVQSSYSHWRVMPMGGGGMPPGGNPFGGRPGMGVKPSGSIPSADGDRNNVNPGATPSRR